MDKILNITNGDSAVETMQAAGIKGDFLPWRDVLHDGPVPEGLSWEALSERRVQFIVERGWGKAEVVRKHVAARDQMLAKVDDYDKVVLWFEHDLYDQLQILQILDWFADRPIKNLTMICTDNYLGMVSPEEMVGLMQHETPVSQAQLDLAQTAWAAFRSSTPDSWFNLLHNDTTALPFLEGAVLRQLEEYPSCENGLSRTANQALEIIHNGEQRPGRVFAAYIETEERKFMGDLSFWESLREMIEASPPLLRLPEGQVLLPIGPEKELTVTRIGKQVLAGEVNAVEAVILDKWIGGVHLTLASYWCWDSRLKEVSRSI